jgi:hypothetical protein
VRGERGSSEVLGSILVFAILVAAVGMFQVTVVPQQNEQAEFDAYRSTITDVAEVNTQIVRTAGQGTEGSATLETGARYPARAVTLNPPAPIGSVELTADASTSVLNARAIEPDEADYWDGSTRSFPTQRFLFRPSYNQFDAAPIQATGYLVYRQPPRGIPIQVSDQSLVRGTRISLISLRGDVYAANEFVALSTVPVSTSSRTVRVTGNDSDGDGTPDPVRLEVPTDLDDTTWDRILAGQMGPDSDQNVESVSVSGGVATVELNGTKTYTLQLSKVELRERADDSVVEEADPAYVVGITETESTRVNDSVGITVQVLDEFGNPIAGEPVTFADNASGSFSEGIVSTDDGGRATVRYRNDHAGKAVVRAQCSRCVGTGEAAFTNVTVYVTGGVDSLNRAPVVEVTDIDQISDNRDVFNVTVEVTDPDENLANVALRLTDPNVDDAGTTISERSENVNGGSAVVTAQLDTDDTATNSDNQLKEYHIAVVVRDEEGAADTESVITLGTT